MLGESFCECVYLYLCNFTYEHVASELVRGADLTALVPEHADYLQNVPSPDSNGASFNMPERAILRHGLSAQMESDFHRLFAPFQALNNLAFNAPKTSENLATDFAKMNSAHEVCKSHYQYLTDVDNFCESLVAISLI